ncbi:IS66 family transposase [Rhizobium sp. TRM96647]|uniref:IS66 family transposase n=1 Tax=unclassified Rhizobium TaxID=2613769 RepID=UPI0021E7C444|nr:MULTISPECIES: IS66 family transposase [unclassified Rhizobium]MCV3739331.1 IS66 family transposase [Rhizobium sp. TRM96647]MCV3760997.1 IS66 family transposase [Rhizobium sp. TRM96650]
MLDAVDLPDDIAALKAMLIASQVREVRKDERIERLEKLVAAFKQAPEQFDLALEDLETAIAAIHAEDEDSTPGKPQPKPRAANRGSLPAHLPHVEEIIEPESLICNCGGRLHCIGEDVSERLDIIPAQFRVIVTRRPKHACRACTDGVSQAPAPARLIQAGLPTEATIAHVLVSKYADHLPLYRQAQIMNRQGLDLDRSTLADWVGRAAFELRPVFDALITDLKRSTKLFMDETRAPVLDLGSRKTKTGYFWALARDDRPWLGGAPPGVAFTYAPGRSGHHAERILQEFTGVLQVDGYTGYNRLIAPDRTCPYIRLAYCWAHARRKLVEITRNGSAPIAEEGVTRIGELYRIEAELRGLDADARLAGRKARSAPLVADLRTWLTHHRARVAGKSPLGEALSYISQYWDGLCVYLTDGRIEIDNNTVERTIRPIALNRKNALFAGHEAGAENWATIASLIETCKLNTVDPLAYLCSTLTAIVNGHKQSRIDELLPWNHPVA